MSGYVHIDDPDCPCGPSIIYVHQEATDHDSTDWQRPDEWCGDESSFTDAEGDPATGYCSLFKGHEGDHYRPAIQGVEFHV